jgi:hypothetical protein
MQFFGQIPHIDQIYFMGAIAVSYVHLFIMASLAAQIYPASHPRGFPKGGRIGRSH